MACRAGLTDNARRMFEDLVADNARVVSLDNIVDGYYISPKFLDKVRSGQRACMPEEPCQLGAYSTHKVLCEFISSALAALIW